MNLKIFNNDMAQLPFFVDLIYNQCKNIKAFSKQVHKSKVAIIVVVSIRVLSTYSSMVSITMFRITLLVNYHLLRNTSPSHK
jgi:hypothetical protein